MCLRIANPAINRVGSGGGAGAPPQKPHQPRRPGRAARLVRIDRSELLLEEAPVDCPSELHHWMSEVDNLVEPRPEKIALARFPTLFRPHQSPRRCPQRSQRITARTPDQFAR